MCVWSTELYIKQWCFIFVKQETEQKRHKQKLYRVDLHQNGFTIKLEEPCVSVSEEGHSVRSLRYVF